MMAITMKTILHKRQLLNFTVVFFVDFADVETPLKHRRKKARTYQNGDGGGATLISKHLK